MMKIEISQLPRNLEEKRAEFYNIHSPTDPITDQQEHDKVGKIEPMFDM